MNKTLTRLFTIALLMMVCIGAWAQEKYVTVNLGANNDGKFDNGTIVEAGQEREGDAVTVTLTVTPATGYTFNKNNVTIYATLSSFSGTRTPEISKSLTLDGPTGDVTKATDYTVTVDANLGVWVESATFNKVSSPQKGPQRSGTSKTFYYIKNMNNSQAFALCISNHNYNGDASMPFLRTKQNPNAYEIWEVRPDGDYYNIIHHADGKYIVANATTQVSQAVHLETITDISALDESKRQSIQFEIESVSGTAFAIRPRGAASTLSFNPTSSNGGDAGNATSTKGDIQLYTVANQLSSQWALEATLPPPAITCNKTDETFILTAPYTEATILYTTDGSTPTATNGTEYTTPIPADGVTVVKAISVDGDVVSPVAELYSPLVSFAFEHKVTDGYYMYPIEAADGDGNPYLHTYSLPRPGMTWHLEPGELVFGVQHYHFVNDETNRYLWFSSSATSVPVLKTTADGDDFQLSLTPINGDNGYFGIASKPTVARWLTNYRYYLNKVNNYDANASSYVGNSNTNSTPGATARWRMKVLTSSTPREDLESAVPFTVSDDESTHYYKLFPKSADTYFIAPPARTTGVDSLVKISNVAADNQAWLIRKASTDDWVTYYYIVNAVTGEYLYYVSDIDNATHANAFITRPISSANEENADRFQFAMAPTTVADRSFIIPKPLHYLNNGMNFNVLWRDNNNPLKVTQSRNNDAVRWGFTAVELDVAPPTITQNAVDNNVTLVTTTVGATIHYTTDGTTPTASSPTYGSAITLTTSMTEIKAIAIKGANSSSVSTLALLPLTGISNQYMIQNQELTDFYLLPSSRQNDGFLSANTYSLLRPSMTWTFVASEKYDNRQYYALRNDSTGCYLWCNSGGTVRLKSATDYGDGSADEFKFTFIQKDDGSYWIVPMTKPNQQINKNSGNNNTNALNTSGDASSLQCRWKFVSHDQLSAPTMPFTVSDDNSAYYYRIKNAGANTYYIVPNNGSNEYANTSNANGTNDRWFIREVANDEWLTYYAIINAETGQCLYFNGNGTTAVINNAFISRSLTTSEMVTADAAQFAIARTTQSASDGYYYLVPKLVRYLNNCDNYSLVLRDGTNALKTQLQRGDAARKWIFESSTFTCAAPTLTEDMVQGTVSITTTNALAKIYYVGYDDPASEPSLTPATGTLYTGPIAIGHTYYKAIVARCDDGSDASDATKLGPISTFRCATPVITFNSVTRLATITCKTESATIYYILDSEFDPENPLSGATLYADPFVPYTGETPQVIRAMAIRGNEIGTISEVAVFDKVLHYISSTSEISNLSGSYAAKDDFIVSGTVGDADHPFTGIFDGAYVPITLTAPLFAKVDGGTVKNVIISSANINTSGSVGAIVGVASGYTRIYNCGILPNDATNSNPSSVGSTNGYCGGLVGWLKDNSRVINCFSYANITGGTDVAGIVGHNEIASTTEVTEGKYANLRTAVVNCMFYGDIKGGTNVYPVYGGKKIQNKGDNSINTYDFYRAEANINVPTTNSSTNYNCSWPALEENLTRFEYYRYLLNSNRELCGWWVNSDVAPSTLTTAEVEAIEKDASLMAKWVLDPSIAPYPILKPAGKYPSIINPDPDQRIDPRTKAWVSRVASENTIETSAKPDTVGQILGTVTVTIDAGSHHSGTAIRVINITAMDLDNNDFCYGKIQLPYYNEVFGNPDGTTWSSKYGNNYTDMVVTGWDVTTSEGTRGTFSDDPITGNNFADRNCTAKDEKRTFAQGGYYYVPYGVSNITITAHWGKAYYLDNGGDYYDRTAFSSAKEGKAFAPAGTRTFVSEAFGGQTINNGTIQSILSNAATVKESTVYDCAIVLVGNHQYRNSNTGVAENSRKPFTLTSVDLDFDNEPDYCLVWQIGQGTNRAMINPVRFDFLPIVEMGVAIKEDDSKNLYAMGKLTPYGHFEVTETSIIHFGQFEYENSGRTIEAPVILNNGTYDQFSRGTEGNNNQHITYFLVGGHTKMPTFSPGAQVNPSSNFWSRHCAVNVLGGEFAKFYLTGNYSNNVTPNTDNPHCYIDGGKFDIVASAAKEGIDGDVYWEIDHAYIGEFYGGGVNADKRVTGSIDITINRSKVSKFCGGPMFGDMYDGKTVTTNALGTTFGVYYGAGNGGTSYLQYDRDDNTNSFSMGKYTTYKHETKINGVEGLNGYHANYELEMVNSSAGTDETKNHRTYVYAAQFATTNTGDVNNTLTDCTIETNFFGGGNLGGVNGSVTSRLKGHTVVEGSVYGAGYSASDLSVEILPKEGYTAPKRDTYTAVITPATYPDKIPYIWTNKTTFGNTTISTGSPHVENPNGDGKNYLFTEIPLVNLGAVSEDVHLTLEDNCKVNGNVFGGGEESAVTGSTFVTIKGSTEVGGNVYGGGNEGAVSGSTTVNIEE